jgi:hypothetical protein
VYPKLHSQALLPFTDSEFVPQGKHSDEPSGANVPAGHTVHESRDVVEPDGHTGHSKTEASPVTGSSFFPAGQALHVAHGEGHATHVDEDHEPSTSEYVPLTQSTQLDTPSLSEYFPRAHLMQLSADEAPSCIEKLPTPHLMHEVVAVSVE